MNGLELYINFKAKYDAATGWVSKYAYGKEFAKHRIAINLAVVIAAVIVAAIYGKLSGNYYYFKIGAILGVVDVAAIAYRWSKL